MNYRNQMMIRSTVLYKLDTLIVHCYQYWMGIPLLSRALHFTKHVLSYILLAVSKKVLK